jgi:hypothetical protein
MAHNEILMLAKEREEKVLKKRPDTNRRWRGCMKTGWPHMGDWRE